MRRSRKATVEAQCGIDPALHREAQVSFSGWTHRSKNWETSGYRKSFLSSRPSTAGVEERGRVPSMIGTTTTTTK
jgi:hypothetical protein